MLQLNGDGNASNRNNIFFHLYLFFLLSRIKLPKAGDFLIEKCAVEI